MYFFNIDHDQYEKNHIMQVITMHTQYNETSL